MKVYARTLNRNKKMELLNAKSLVSEAIAQETREALGQSVAKMPDEATQARHRLTRLPNANWCKECIEHRARPDRRVRTDGTKRGSVPAVSFDFCYTRARDSETKSARAVCWLDAIDVHVHFVPLGSKNKCRLIVQELVDEFQPVVWVFSNHLQEGQRTRDKIDPQDADQCSIRSCTLDLGSKTCQLGAESVSTSQRVPLHMSSSMARVAKDF